MPALDSFFEKLDRARLSPAVEVPPRAAARSLADRLFQLLFPVLTDDRRPVAAVYEQCRFELIQLLDILLKKNGIQPEAIADDFFEKLPVVYEKLLEDGAAMLAFDPAATCREEVIATYPGFYAIALYRLANVLHQLQVPLLPRTWTEYVHSETGIDIHPAATIGRSFFIDHGTGVVIGATAVIGDHVKVYQGVTLGALQVDKSLANVKRHPTIGDHCILYANSTILGGKTEIGHHSIIGGNTWLTESVPPYSLVFNQAKITVRTKANEEPLNFVI